MIVVDINVHVNGKDDKEMAEPDHLRTMLIHGCFSASDCITHGHMKNAPAAAAAAVETPQNQGTDRTEIL